MIISNIKCQLRVNLFDKIKTSQQNIIQKAVLKNFAIFTGKHLCWSFFLIKLQLQTPTQVFPKNISNFLRTPILKIVCEWLHLIMTIWTIFSRKHT